MCSCKGAIPNCPCTRRLRTASIYKKAGLVNDTINIKSAEEPLADWEKELLKPCPNQVIHMYPAEGMTSCKTKLDNGMTHVINSNIEVVSCGECKINYLNYVNVEQNRQIEELKEKARVAEMTINKARNELRNAAMNANRLRGQNRRLQEELSYARGENYYPRPPYAGYRPVDEYGRVF